MYSPWRSQYIKGFKEPKKSRKKKSVFADIKKKDDKKRLVVHRGKKAFIIMNLYPYNSGHLMVIPFKQTADFSELDRDTKLEMMDLVELCIKILTQVMKPHGFNIGVNLGKVSGGSVDTHLHFHVVPRWNGDTNFMPVIGNTKVISDDMKRTYKDLREAIKQILQ
jgi:ATP adenylyltransferase